MFRNLLSSILIVTSSLVIAIGQTPEAPKEKERTRSFAFSFDGDGGYLGVQTQEVTRENFSKFGLSSVRGVAVEKVVENSPAAAAGLKAGDVIVRFNGEEITSTRKLTRLISEVAPDHHATITISRNGREQDVTATLGKRPEPKFADGNFLLRTPMPPMPPMPSMPEFKEFPRGELPRVFTVPGGEGETLIWRSGDGRVIGVGVTPLTKKLASHYGVESGVMINDVRENSPAAKAGLKAGDIITECEGKTVKREMDLIRSISEKKEGDVTLTIIRNGNRQTITVTPEKSKGSGFFFETGDDPDGK
ncbi:MAG: PDZ domain-containing protein [Pyrinomonadaceae bacterium]